MSSAPRQAGPRKKFGFDLLKAQVLDSIAGEMEWIVDDVKVGDSEIERLFFVSLKLVTQFAGSEFRDVELAASEADEARIMAEYRCDHGPIYIVRPQAHVLDYRVDFLIHTHDRRSPIDPGRLKWRRLVVECDGHDYERTKEQAAKDRSRDRDLTSRGYDVFRFTGSELWTDPYACARQALEWAVTTW